MNKLKLKHLKHICFEGIISSGKTTMCKNLISKSLQGEFLEEPVDDNPYLNDFYAALAKGGTVCRDTRIGAMMQLYLLSCRYENHLKSIWGNLDDLCIEDRSIYGDTVFASMLRESGDIDQRDYDNYMRQFRVMSNYLKYPDLIVFLDVSPEEAMFRMKTLRQRKCEVDVTLDYLKNLRSYYVRMISRLNQFCPIIRISNGHIKRMPGQEETPIQLPTDIFWYDSDEELAEFPDNLATHVATLINEFDNKYVAPFMHLRKAKGNFSL